MKRLYLTVFIIVLLPLLTCAQKIILVRDFPMQFLSRDSVIAYYNENYYLIEDSCATIVRRGFFNDALGKFTGPFEDRSKAAPKQVIAKGRYNKQGLKEGEFAAWYLNGKLQARGSFKEDRYHGIWDFYSPSGKPRLTFEADGDSVTIIDAWDEDGHRTAKNGKGTYEMSIGSISWSGKILNGKPHGPWIATVRSFGNQGYIPNNRQVRILATEVFSNGAFQKGTNPTGSYNDSSRIRFYPPVLLPLTVAEDLVLTKAPCNGRYSKRFVYAHPLKGPQQFINEISERLTPLVAQMDTAAFENSVELQMEVTEDGKIVNDSASSSNAEAVNALKEALHGLVAFTPAAMNGKAIQQGIKVIIHYYQGKYYFDYVLMPIELM